MRIVFYFASAASRAPGLKSRLAACKTLASLILACFLNFPSIFPSSSCLAEMRILLLVTTHFPAYHQNFLETCWPPATRKSALLQQADVIAATSPYGFRGVAP